MTEVLGRDDPRARRAAAAARLQELIRPWELVSTPLTEGVDFALRLDQPADVPGVAPALVLWVHLAIVDAGRATRRGIPYALRAHLLKQFEEYRLPVLLLGYDPKAKTFYHLVAQRYVGDVLDSRDPDWRGRRGTTVHFAPSAPLPDAPALGELAVANLEYLFTWGLRPDDTRFWLHGIEQWEHEAVRQRTRVALGCLAQARPQEAIAIWEEVLRGTMSSREQAATYLNLGNAYYAAGRYESARVSYELVLSMASRASEAQAGEQGSMAIGDPDALLWAQMAAMGNLGLAHRQRADTGKALECHETALEAARALGYREGEAAQLGHIAAIHLAHGELDSALRAYRQALAIHRELGNRQGEATALSAVGGIYRRRGDLGNAQRHHREALALHRRLGAREPEAADLRSIGAIHHARGALDEALGYYESAQAIYGEVGNVEQEAHGLISLGAIHQARGELGEAARCYQDALADFRKQGLRRGQAVALGNLGLIYQARGELHPALLHFQAALEINREVGNRQGEAIQLGNVGTVLRSFGQWNEALEHHEEAYKLHRRMGYRQGEATALANIGMVHCDLGDMEKGLDYLRHARAILDEFGLAAGREAIERAIHDVEGLVSL